MCGHDRSQLHFTAPNAAVHLFLYEALCLNWSVELRLVHYRYITLFNTSQSMYFLPYKDWNAVLRFHQFGVLNGGWRSERSHNDGMLTTWHSHKNKGQRSSLAP